VPHLQQDAEGRALPAGSLLPHSGSCPACGQSITWLEVMTGCSTVVIPRRRKAKKSRMRAVAGRGRGRKAAAAAAKGGEADIGFAAHAEAQEAGKERGRGRGRGAGRGRRAAAAGTAAGDVSLPAADDVPAPARRGSGERGRGQRAAAAAAAPAVATPRRAKATAAARAPALHAAPAALQEEPVVDHAEAGYVSAPLSISGSSCAGELGGDLFDAPAGREASPMPSPAAPASCGSPRGQQSPSPVAATPLRPAAQALPGMPAAIRAASSDWALSVSPAPSIAARSDAAAAAAAHAPVAFAAELHAEWSPPACGSDSLPGSPRIASASPPPRRQSGTPASPPASPRAVRGLQAFSPDVLSSAHQADIPMSPGWSPPPVEDWLPENATLNALQGTPPPGWHSPHRWHGGETSKQDHTSADHAVRDSRGSIRHPEVQPLAQVQHAAVTSGGTAAGAAHASALPKLVTCASPIAAAGARRHSPPGSARAASTAHAELAHGVCATPMVRRHCRRSYASPAQAGWDEQMLNTTPPPTQPSAQHTSGARAHFAEPAGAQADWCGATPIGSENVHPSRGAARGEGCAPEEGRGGQTWQPALNATESATGEPHTGSASSNAMDEDGGGSAPLRVTRAGAGGAVQQPASGGLDGSAQPTPSVEGRASCVDLTLS
jgi:hypothetical protein